MSKSQKHQGPGRADRQGISLLKLTEMFPDEAAARQWFEEVRWAAGRYCGHCGSTRTHHVASERPYAVPLLRLPEVFQRPHWDTDAVEPVAAP